MIDATAKIPTLQEIRAAATRLAPHIIRTPLLRLNLPDRPDEIYLKLENLQPIGAFKVRPMGNALLTVDKNVLRHGAYTASSGNAGLGLAWMADILGISARVYAPDTAPESKLEAMRRFGAEIHLLTVDDWWKIIVNSCHPTDPGFYVDAVRSPSAMAGNGTIGLEIAEQLSDVDRVIVPFGGGGVACGIAAAMRALKPDVKLIVAESDAATPVTAALEAGRPVAVTVRPSFISGAGAPSVLEEMWPLVSQSVDGTIVSSVTEVADAVRLLLEHNHVIAEGAGAIALAAALSGEDGTGKTVCVVTGGNIDRSVLSKILNRQPV
jgi:threonine dehydratase